MVLIQSGEYTKKPLSVPKVVLVRMKRMSSPRFLTPLRSTTRVLPCWGAPAAEEAERATVSGSTPVETVW